MRKEKLVCIPFTKSAAETSRRIIGIWDVGRRQAKEGRMKRGGEDRTEYRYD